MGRNNTITHRFFCLNCGNESVPLSRKRGHQHERFHRKKCFCLTCKCCVNHIECKNDEDVYEFRQAFENGEFKEEAEKSIAMNEPITGLWG